MERIKEEIHAFE